MPRRRTATNSQKDRFILGWMAHSDSGRAYREAGLAPDTPSRRTNGQKLNESHVHLDRRNGERLLADPYVVEVLGGFRRQQIEKFAEEADATRFEIMDGYRKVVEAGMTSGARGDLSAVVRSLDGMARLMGYLVEHKVIHHERSDKRIDQMKTPAELRAFIRGIVAELGEPTARLLLGGNEITDGEIVGDASHGKGDRGANGRGTQEPGEGAGSSPAQ